MQLEAHAIVLGMPDGRRRRHELDGCAPLAMDGCFEARALPATRSAGEGHGRAPGPKIEGPGFTPGPGGSDPRGERRFVRMLVLEQPSQPTAVIVTPPDEGAVAPSVVRIPAAPIDAAIVDAPAWDALAEWATGGGRLAGLAIADLARLAAIATPQFAVLIGEVAAQRALDLVDAHAGPHRGDGDLHHALQPLTTAARSSPRAREAALAAIAYVASASRRKRRWRGAW